MRRILARLSRLLNIDIRDLIKQGRLVDAQFVGELQSILLRAEVPTQDVERVLDAVQRSYLGRVVQLDDLFAVMQTEFSAIRR